jgi:hypothetical protein
MESAKTALTLAWNNQDMVDLLEQYQAKARENDEEEE